MPTIGILQATGSVERNHTMTSQQHHWFASSWFGQFMASAAGRWVRVIAGIALVAGGLGPIGGTTGIVVAVIGLVPLLAGAFDVCVFSALFGGPFVGRAIRAIGHR